jgi:dolichol-phosphate mannosyltransferase
MSRRALDAFLSLPEQARFIRGMVAWVGFRQVPFPYDRAERHAGETNYPLGKMVRLAFDAVTGFSTAPLRLASHASVILAFASLLLLFYIAWGFFSGNMVQGWTSTMLVVVVLSAIQMFVLGMIGEYLGRLYVESKRRPLYLVADVAGPVQGRATLGFKAEESARARFGATPPASGGFGERHDRDAGRHRHPADQVPLQPEDALEQPVDRAGRG